MSQGDIEEKRNTETPKDDLFEFQMRSLDIDIAFYGNKLQKAKKN